VATNLVAPLYEDASNVKTVMGFVNQIKVNTK
jgi:hypothetical protein